MATATINNDILLGKSGADFIDGLAGDDLILGMPVSSLPQGQLGELQLDGPKSGNDILIGGQGRDAIFGGDGNDTIFGGDGDDRAWANYSFFEASNDLITFNGRQFPYALYGGKGNDTIYGGNGQDVLNGGAGDDLLLGADNNSDDGSFDGLIGEEGNDTLYGGVGKDLQSGGDGNDILIGTLNANRDFSDVFFGGSGNDTVKLISATGVNVSLDDSSGVYLANSIENIVIVTNWISGAINNARNIITGNAQNNILTGGGVLNGREGNDTLKGGSKSGDLLFGDTGNDTLQGGAGGDTIDGGEGLDTASYFDSARDVTVALQGRVTFKGDALGDKLSNIEDLSGSNRGNDTLIGSNLANFIYGNGGKDNLKGLSGDDTLIGGKGADRLEGGAGFDSAGYLDSTASVTANLLDSGRNTGDAKGDSYSSIEGLRGGAFGDRLTGDNQFNFIYGLGGNDTLFGLGGSDTLRGGKGIDTLYGGNGQDFFQFESVSDVGATQGDKIADFKSDDTIVLKLSGFQGITAASVSPSIFHIGKSNRAADSSDRLIYNTSDTTLWYDSNGSAAGGTKVMIADFGAGVRLTFDDISFI
jgi:Ca2+-binding RTX toxin-like protein